MLATCGFVLAMVPETGAQQSLPKGSAPGSIGRAAMAITRSDPRDFRLPSTAREVAAERSAKTKRFRVRAGGRTRFAEVATGKALHYRDAEGRWKGARGEFRGEGLDDVADALPFRVGTTKAGLAIGTRDGGAGIRFLTRKRPIRGGRRITTAFAGQRIKWDWVLSEAELKLISHRVASPRGRRELVFPFELFGGFPAFAVGPHGAMSNGVLRFARPFLLGGDGEAYDGSTSWEVRPSAGQIVLHVDDAALPRGAYPYRIDPPVTEFGEAAADYFEGLHFASWFPSQNSRFWERG